MSGLRKKTSEHQGDCIILLKQIKQQSDSTLYEWVNWFLFQKTFHYNSKLWSNKVDFNLPGGKTGLDTHETKLPTYWNTPFNKICLGMKIGQQFKSVVINHQARSLYSLFADGKYRATSLGRNTWKKLLGSRASLQPNCNKEGFNVVCTYKDWSKARIGILGNKEDDCSNCDSRIGFGIGGYHDELQHVWQRWRTAHQSDGIHLSPIRAIIRRNSLHWT